MSDGLTPVRAHLVRQEILVDWNLEVEPDWDDERRLADLVERGLDYPGGFRNHLNALRDLLDDERRTIADRSEFLSDATNRWFDAPEHGLEWLGSIVDALSATRPSTVRTVAGDGPVLGLAETDRLFGLLRYLRSDGLVSADAAGRTALDVGDRLVAPMGEFLSIFTSSALSDRDKADLIVGAVGEHFHTDLEAIEWAAEVARAIQHGPRSVE